MKKKSFEIKFSFQPKTNKTLVYSSMIFGKFNSKDYLSIFKFNSMVYRFWYEHWKSIVWGVFILMLCSIPGNQINRVKFIDIPHLDKFIHFFLYFVFTLLLISENNTSKHHRKVTVNAILIAAAISIPTGAIIEILQKVILIGRSSDVLDLVANVFGFLAATLSYRQVNRITEGYI